ncbi:zinc-binding dehydrogenase [Streptomyces sp. NPDC050264]|uniref:zinc-dependent alcohol dehydrogenase n=1 Tax=Streptomyces sp. NPDC050264 TaxID=3155038 RepID=UPI0034400C69
MTCVGEFQKGKNLVRAAVYNGPRDISLVEMKTPACGDDDVLLRNLYASVCGSDISAYFHGPRAHRITPGSEFGHEMVSEVAVKGKNVTGLEVGDRVYPYPALAAGDSSRAGTLGGFSEYILVPNCEVGRQVYPVSTKVSSRTAALIEPFTVATHAARRSNPKAGETAVVFGAGTIGMGVAIALRYFGCSTVMVVDISDFRLRKAADLGFATCNSAKQDLGAKAREVFGTARSLSGHTADVDIFVEATGVNAPIDTYQVMGKLFSRLVVVGVHHTPYPVDFASLAYAQHSIIGSGGYLPEDVDTVMDIMESGDFDIESIITHEFPQHEIVRAIETASATDGALNVVIKY